MTIQPRAIGAPVPRLDGPAKVTGAATYAYEQPVDAPLYLYPVQSTIANGRVIGMDTTAARALDGVLDVLAVGDAPGLADTSDGDLTILQDDRVHYRGQIIGGVVADSIETAREAASRVTAQYQSAGHRTELRPDDARLYAPEKVNPDYPTDTSQGDVVAALRDCAVSIDQTYTTPLEHNNPMEPHATIAVWDGSALTIFASTQGVHVVREKLATAFGLDPGRIRVVAPYVGGGFGSKGTPHSHDVLTVMAALRLPGRPVKLALTRQQMFALVGYRTNTIQRVRLGASADGRLTAIGHDVIEQTATIKEYAEQTAISARMMYASPNRVTSHRLAPLDVPAPFWMRAPGECPGMFALESALDELAVALDLDPIELRVRNEPEVDPENGHPWSDRRLIECLRVGADRFGWCERDSTPGTRREGEWLIGTGVASAVYPAKNMPGNTARIAYAGDGRFTVSIGAADIGTGTWTALAQIAADALDVDLRAVDLRIGDSALPPASVEGASSGLSSWGLTVCTAAQAFRREHGEHPTVGDTTVADAPDRPTTEQALYSFGAQFAEARVNRHTGEIRIPRMFGAFSVGRVINPLTLRSQLIGGMTMGLSMALHEDSVRDHRFGHVVTQDFAGYHIASHADVADIDAVWIDSVDTALNPMGSRGAGEIGIVGAAAAITNAIHHATGVRVRDLPVTCDALMPSRRNVPTERL
jgi:xanthine dehydrogenase YagR molybdenum-binding subunit